MGLFDFLKKDTHKDWALLSLNDISAFINGFTTEQLHEAILDIDVGRTLTLMPKEPPQYGCICIEYTKDEKTKKLCLYAGFEQEDGYRNYKSENVPPEEAFRIMSAYTDLKLEPDVSGWKLEKFLKNMEPVTFNQFVMMFTGDKDIIARLEQCADSPLSYLMAHPEIIPPDDIDESYADREFNDILKEGATKRNTEYILLNAFAYEMYKAGIMARVSVSPDVEEFAAAVEPLAKKHNLQFNTGWFDPDADDSDWCTVLEEKWHYDGYVIIEPDIRSIYTFYYVCSCEEKDEILLMAKRAGISILSYGE